MSTETQRSLWKVPQLILNSNSNKLNNFFSNLWLDLRCRLFNGTLEANDTDIEEGIKLFEPISECNPIGLSPHQFRVWKEILEPLIRKNDEVEFSTFRQEYYGKFHHLLTPKGSSLYVQSFVDTSLCLTRKSDVDGRKTVIVSIKDSNGVTQAMQQRFP